jgi:dephospho-CoA kinase
MPKMRRLLGITGGIASGKTMVMRFLSKAGIPTVSADDLAHACIRRGKPAYRAILRHFGKAILASSRQIDRHKLGRIVFADPQKRKRLEKIVHPCVLRALKQFVHRKKGLIALDIPLLYETGYDKWLDTVAVVYASKAQQIQRLRRRNGLTRTEALQRIAAQMPSSAKCRRADIILRNTGSPEHLRHQIAAFLKKQI